ncbi:DUF1330 domain-containing protein [Nocardia sp. NPDC059091]|uniref:DUF1330 domain-containing protein n=1 Tax=unclassified Nocardia TaxID=2637762 RepID=UPI0036A8FFF4
MTVESSVYIEPTEHQVGALVEAAGHASGPVIMLNLLKFNDEGGRDSYLRYARDVQPHLERVGASIVYVGDAGSVVIGHEGDAWWDTILLVQYPSRSAFLDMVMDPGYQEVSRHRTAALTTSALVATDPWLVDLS